MKTLHCLVTDNRIIYVILRILFQSCTSIGEDIWVMINLDHSFRLPGLPASRCLENTCVPLMDSFTHMYMFYPQIQELIFCLQSCPFLFHIVPHSKQYCLKCTQKPHGRIDSVWVDMCMYTNTYVKKKIIHWTCIHISQWMIYNFELWSMLVNYNIFAFQTILSLQLS